MMLSVIIPTRNRSDLLSKCLNRLHPSVQFASAELYEVIVTDDSTNHISKEFINNNYSWVRWVEGTKKGPAANRNNGAKYANGDWLIFIDDDCLPGGTLLNEYINAIGSNPKTFAFEGAILPDDWRLLKKDMAECPVNINGGCFWSANICVQKKLFESIGGFNERFLIAAQEDQQLKIDIEKSDYSKILFVKNASVVHPVRFSSLRKKISSIPIASKNFCMYAYYNKEILGYNSASKFLKNQITIHFKQIWLNLKNKKMGSFLVEAIWLLWGVPLNSYNFFSLCHKRSAVNNESAVNYK